MRVAIYSRVSTKDKRQEISNQVNQLRDFCLREGFAIVQEYADHDSGSKADRGEFQKMLRDAAAKKFDLVLFWALDRFTREGTLATLKYFEILRQALLIGTSDDMRAQPPRQDRRDNSHAARQSCP